MKLLSFLLLLLWPDGDLHAQRSIRVRIALSAPEQLRTSLVKALTDEAQRIGDVVLLFDSQPKDSVDCELHMVAVALSFNSGLGNGVVISTAVTTPIIDTVEDIIEFADVAEGARTGIRESLRSVRNYRAMLVNGGTNRDVGTAIAELVSSLNVSLFPELRQRAARPSRDRDKERTLSTVLR